jgi:site-specific DNA-methyltransferase (adenine-specific)
MIGAASAGTLSGKTGTWADAMNASHWFGTWFGMVAATLKPTGLFWSFLNWRTMPTVMKAAIDARLPITSMAVWDKEWIGPGGPQGLRPSYELIALLARPEAVIPDRGIPDVIRCKTSGFKPNGHPAEKPVKLFRRLLEISAVTPGACVLDPFAGSGTTQVASRLLGLRCVAIEADERYCELAASRLAQGILI